MHYIIQENVFREVHYDRLRETLDRLGLPYTVVRIFPFVDRVVDLLKIPNTEGNYIVDELPELELDTCEGVFPFGAIKLARICVNKNWTPGSQMNANHDYRVYSQYYRENLLNWDSEILELTADLNWLPGEKKFIRPTADTKSFTGAVFTQTEWEGMLENYLHNYRSKIFNETTTIQVSSPKKIYKEIRFWVVNGKIVTGSQYRLGDAVIYDERYEDEALEFAQSMVDLFQLAEAFVIDVCLADSGWRVVECGCINAAGFYKSDLQKLIIALEDHFSPVDGSRSLG